MKITKEYLKQIIKEEVSEVNEGDASGNTTLALLNGELKIIKTYIKRQQYEEAIAKLDKHIIP